MIKMFLATSVIAAIVTSVGLSAPLKSEYINDLETRLVSREVASYSDYKIEYTMSVQSYPMDQFSKLYIAYPIEDVHNAMNEIIKYYLLFNSDKKKKTDDCRSGFNINIFIIGEREMADSSRFAKYLKSIGLPEGRVYAFYDATPNTYANSAIILTDISPRQNYLSLAHELAHYMWDRQCLSRYYDVDSETFSREFERYINEKTN